MALPRRNLSAVISQILVLPDWAKFVVFEVLRKDLGGRLDIEHPDNQLIRERQEALVYMEKAIQHLGLDAREVPTQAQFDQVAKEQDWEWTGAKVKRVWERWKMATDAYLGLRRIRTPEARKRMIRPRGPRDNPVEKHLEALEEWLATNPEIETWNAYNDFAEIRNASLPSGKFSLARASTIAYGLPVNWKNGIKVARKEMTLKEATEQELAESLPAVLDDKTIVGLPQIQRLLKASHRFVSLLSKDSRFPVAVAHLDGHSAWLYDDVKLYRRKLPTPKRSEGEYQRLFVSRSELLAQLDCDTRFVRAAINKQDWGLIPQPEGELAISAPYWRREKVEAWQRQAK